jgi:hypothetical protein
VDVPARLPDGSPSHLSVNRTLGGGAAIEEDHAIEKEDR